MMAHYLYSMANFGDIILDALRLTDVRDIVEIGAEFGEMSDRLLDHAVASGGSLTSIDPAPAPQFREWLAARPGARHISEPSLSALAHVPRGRCMDRRRRPQLVHGVSRTGDDPDGGGKGGQADAGVPS